MDLHGKTALITGGSSGIGLATAKLFLEHGAQVAILGRDPDRLAAAATTLGPQVLTLQGDVRSPAELVRMREQLVATMPALDIVFANAGVAYTTPLATTDEARFDDIMATNVKGVFFTVQTFAPLMKRGGSIILNTSWLAQVGSPGLSLLSASKAAVRSLARTLAADLNPKGIRVNAVSPGAIDTPIHAKSGMTPEQLQNFQTRYPANIPMRRFGRPEEIAGAALFLASDRSSYMLGAEIVVDGGFSQL